MLVKRRGWLLIKIEKARLLIKLPFRLSTSVVVKIWNIFFSVIAGVIL